MLGYIMGGDPFSCKAFTIALHLVLSCASDESDEAVSTRSVVLFLSSVALALL